jgi:glycosyltransferase involved in cell wall biosynthesis
MEGVSVYTLCWCVAGIREALVCLRFHCYRLHWPLYDFMQKMNREDTKCVHVDCGFDPEWYVTHYADVSASGMDPFEHYTKIGRALNRLPSSSSLPVIRDPNVNRKTENTLGSIPNACGVEQANGSLVKPARISVITPIYKTPVYYLERLAASLWAERDAIEWVVVNDSPGLDYLESFFDRMKSCFPNLTYVRNQVNKGIFASYIAGVNVATAPYVAILDHDDEVDLAPIIADLKRVGDRYDLLYTDEIRFGQSISAHFEKPAFDPMSSMHYFYMHHITLFRTSLCKQLIHDDRHAEKKYNVCFDVWLSLSYILHYGAGHLQSKHIPYPCYGWRVHDDSTAKDIGQKPIGETERIDMATNVYRERDPLAFIELDNEHRYLVRYRYPIASPGDCIRLSRLVFKLFNVYSPSLSEITEQQMGCECNSLLKALENVPLAYLEHFIAGKCFVVLRASIHPDSEMYGYVARHLRGVPILRMLTDEVSSADRLLLVNLSICILVPKRSSHLNAGNSPSHVLFVE